MLKRTLANLALAIGIASLPPGGALISAHAAVTNTSAVVPERIATDVWAASAGGAEIEFLVVLEEQADLSSAAAIPDRGDRLQYVRDTLLKFAQRTQLSLLTDLGAAGLDYRRFYVANLVWVRGDRGAIVRLAERTDVSRIVGNPEISASLPDPDRALGVDVPAGIEWGVSKIRADDVWAMGYTGESVVVAGQDTGYDWEHPALINQYRGTVGGPVSHDYNWHDAIHSGGGICGADSPVPCDDHGHGTHTMGTAVGDDGGTNQIGVAPGARWIGCRNMDQGVGTPETYIECFEFFLAPYPVGGDPLTDGDSSLAPHIINNSWTCPPSEGCDWDSLQTVVENVRAAGILVVVSAGNSGLSCSTVQDPPAIYDAAFTVGATGSSDAIASFSSCGPVTIDGSGRSKPDIVAPGVSVRSSIPGGGYGLKDGTSMAGPHVAGTVALLWSAAPYLVGNVVATEWAIASTAVALTTAQGCGGDTATDVPNNVYGWGRVDAFGAVWTALYPISMYFPIIVRSG